MLSQFFSFIGCLFMYPLLALGIGVFANRLHCHLQEKKYGVINTSLKAKAATVAIVVISIFWIANAEFSLTAVLGLVPLLMLVLYLGCGISHIYQNSGKWYVLLLDKQTTLLSQKQNTQGVQTSKTS